MDHTPTYPKRVSLGICATASQGVVIACYSDRHSRMTTWDPETMAVTGFQDFKGPCSLLDISPDAKLCAYHAGNPDGYLAISKPPYFKALFLTPAEQSWTEAAYFGDDGVFHYRRSEPGRSIPNLKPQTQNAGPYRPREYSVFYSLILGGLMGARIFSRFDRALERCSTARIDQDSLAWRGEDSQGRKIWTDGKGVFADDLAILYLAQPPFEDIAPPEWATHW